MKAAKIIFVLFVLLIFIGASGGLAVHFLQSKPGVQQSATPQNNVANKPGNAVVEQQGSQDLASAPIDQWQLRVTKKPFGIYVSPTNSPVTPERFIGYHTGVDFETFPDEQNTDVNVMAICDGKLLVKEYASGYGGVAVQQCRIDNQDVTVIYGHLKISSITAAKGQALATGEKLGILGKGYSAETDGERKHLHLGIHKGTAVDILGYVQTQAELSGWLDVIKYLQK